MGEFTPVKQSDQHYLWSVYLADHLVEEHDRSHRYCCSRSFLRRALGLSLNVPFYDGHFTNGPYGKPRFLNPSLGAFNLTHSRKFIMVAHASADEYHDEHNMLQKLDVGIDTESCFRKVSVHLLRYMLTDSELDYVLASENWNVTALKFWTMKEAVLKCMGSGLTTSLRRVSLQSDPSQDDEYLFEVKQNGLSQLYRVISWIEGDQWISSVAINDAVTPVLLEQYHI